MMDHLHKVHKPPGQGSDHPVWMEFVGLRFRLGRGLATNQDHPIFHDRLIQDTDFLMLLGVIVKTGIFDKKLVVQAPEIIQSLSRQRGLDLFQRGSQAATQFRSPKGAKSCWLKNRLSISVIERISPSFSMKFGESFQNFRRVSRIS